MSGPDPAQLRAAATRLRSLASGLDEPVAALPGKYPQGSTWLGPAANQFYGDLKTIKGAIARCAADLDTYAGALDRKASQPRSS